MSSKKSNWYERNIEPEVRDLVRLLRNNGYNTFRSCGHDEWISFAVEDPKEAWTLMLFLRERNYENFEIHFEIHVGKKEWSQTMTLYLDPSKVPRRQKP